MKVHQFTNTVALVAVLTSVALAVPAPPLHVVHEKRDDHSHTWVKRERINADAVIPVRIGLKQSNLDRGYGYLMDVSHPSSPNYGKHWTAEEVADAFSPSNETLKAVREWLVASGIANHRVTHSDNKGWFAFDATAAETEALLHTEFHEHEHLDSGKWAVGCDQYHLPVNIQEHVDFVTPGVKWSILKKKNVRRAVKKRGWMPGHGSPSGPWQHPSPSHMPKGPSQNADLATCWEVITPVCIAALYQFPPATTAHPGNSLGIFEEGDTYAQEDSIDGGHAPVPVADAGGESDLDFQLAYPIVYPQTITLYQVDDDNYNNGTLTANGFGNTFLDALDGSYCTYTAFGETGDDPVLDPTYPDTLPGGYNGPLMCGVYKPTNVISISYGEQENQLPVNYQKRQCNEFLKLGLQGTSIFVASGDYGVAGPHGRKTNGCLGPNSTIFSPTNPNSCPYVTNVGATFILPNHTVHEPENAVWGEFDNGTSLFTSSGGFSNIYPIPQYQAAAVATYFATDDPPYPYYETLDSVDVGAGGGIYNRIGHGIPDIAAVGLWLGIYNEGEYALFGGTSASSPIVASIFNRIIEERLSIGKGPIGFVNPVLYQHPEILNDITNGTNPGCGTNGFSAVKGWDPVTGLGTPNYPKMLEFFLRLP